jgi:hypothetical protein
MGPQGPGVRPTVRGTAPDGPSRDAPPPGERGTSNPLGRFPGGGDAAPRPGGQPGAGAPTSDPLREAEAALKRLREARDAEGQRQAVEALEQALEKLKQHRQDRPAAR